MTEWILLSIAGGMIIGWFIFVLYLINLVENSKNELTSVTYAAYL